MEKLRGRDKETSSDLKKFQKWWRGGGETMEVNEKERGRGFV